MDERSGTVHQRCSARTVASIAAPGRPQRTSKPPGWRIKSRTPAAVSAARQADPCDAHPARKVQVTLRLDKDVAGWFWQQGQGY